MEDEEVVSENTEEKTNGSATEEFSAEQKKEFIENSEKKKAPKTKRDADLDYLNLDVKQLMNLPENVEFRKIFIEAVSLFKDRHFQDIKKIKNEVEFYNNYPIIVDLEQDTEIEIYNHTMDVLQSYRDRLTTIISDTYADWNFIKKIYDDILEIWTGRFSKLSSDRRREAEGKFILHFLLKDRIERENLYKNVENVSMNITNKIEIVSRKISVLQIVYKVMGAGVNVDAATEVKLKNNRKKINEKIVEIKANSASNWGELKK